MRLRLNLCLNLVHALGDERHLLHLGEADQGIGGDELGLEVGQRANAVVFLLVAIGTLVADEGNEEAEF